MVTSTRRGNKGRGKLLREEEIGVHYRSERIWVDMGHFTASFSFSGITYRTAHACASSVSHHSTGTQCNDNEV
jgi:hypothetical protein